LKLHRDGLPFIAIAVLIDAALWLFVPLAGLIVLPLTIWTILFFRDPDRRIPAGKNLIVSPADGLLLPVSEAAPPPELGFGPDPKQKLSIFMNVFNVHVNRVPASGVIKKLAYRPGKFFNASFDKASELNERMAIRLALAEDAGPKEDIAFVQIAGLVARRIHCALTEGESVCRGDRFGIIRFGSRLDVYLPGGARIRVSAGQKVKAGETVLADFPS